MTIKLAYHTPYYLLKPLEIPACQCSLISIDFIIGLAMSNVFDTVLVVVDCLFKIAYYIPTIIECNSETLAKLFRDYVFRLYDLPNSIVTDKVCNTLLSFPKSSVNSLESNRSSLPASILKLIAKLKKLMQSSNNTSEPTTTISKTIS